MNSPFSTESTDASSTPSPTSFATSSLGTSFIALSVLPVLAIAIYAGKRYRTWRRNCDSKHKSTGISSKDFFAADEKGAEYDEKDTKYIAKPQVAYQSSRDTNVKQVQRYSTPEKGPIPSYLPPLYSPTLNTTYQPVDNYMHPPTSPCSPANRFPSYRPPPSYPFSDSSLAISQALLWSRNADIVIGSHPHALPVRSRMQASTPVVDISGNLLIHIPWRPDYGHVSDSSYAAEATRCKRSRRRSHTVHCETDLARIYDGNVDDRYPVALSTSCISLYSRAPSQRSECSSKLETDGSVRSYSKKDMDDESCDDMSRMLNKFPAVPVSFRKHVRDSTKSTHRRTKREFTGVDLNGGNNCAQTSYAFGYTASSNAKDVRGGKAKGEARKPGRDVSKENIIPF